MCFGGQKKDSNTKTKRNKWFLLVQFFTTLVLQVTICQVFIYLPIAGGEIRFCDWFVVFLNSKVGNAEEVMKGSVG